jgi:SWI/SNF-related matrix-associated actin-dependent regulator 1 of chromatin subfamily A
MNKSFFQNTIDKEKIKQDNKKFLTRLSSFNKLNQIPPKLRADKSIARLRIDLGLLKVPTVINDAKLYIKENKSVVLFVEHHQVVKEYKKHFGNDCYVITGQTNIKERDKAVKGFQVGKRPVIILSYGAGKEGLTLTKSHVMLQAEIHWEAIVMSQAEDRIHRVGQAEECLIKVYYIPDSLDTYILGLVNEKTRVARRIT